MPVLVRKRILSGTVCVCPPSSRPVTSQPAVTSRIPVRLEMSQSSLDASAPAFATADAAFAIRNHTLCRRS